MTTAIDLFAGLGGFTTGAEKAGVEVLFAANHWQIAVDTHQKNHPTTRHLCQDLHQANWELVPSHDLLLASPACQGHSLARGKDRAHHDVSRSSAWAVVSAAEYHRPRAILIENVPEMASKWVLFPAFRLAIEALGYAFSTQVIDAADCGVPQNRRRLLIPCTRSRNPIALDIAKEDHIPAQRIIDFAQGKWAPIRHARRSQKTIDRIENGRRRYGERFVAPYYGSGSGLTGRSLRKPIGTVTTRDRWAVVDGDKMRMLTIPEYKRAMSFDEDYQLPGRSKRLDLHLLGNAIPPVMAQKAIQALIKRF